MSKLFKKALVMVAGFFMAVSVFATNHEGQSMQNNNTTIVIVASGNKDFSTLVTAIKEAALVKALSGKGPFTVFAPTNEAFNQLPAGTLDKLLKNKRELRAVLTYHVIPGKITSQDIKDGKVKTLNGEMLTISKSSDGTVMVNGAKVTQADIMAGNGVIHVIDQVLIPPKNGKMMNVEKPASSQ